MSDAKLNGSLHRRDFLRGSLATAVGLSLRDSAAELGVDRMQNADAAVSPLRPVEPLGQRENLMAPRARFRELQLGSVIPTGWLKTELDKQADGIAGHQTSFCFPFDRRYWASNERGQDVESRNGGTFWYPWEQMGYWTDGAYRCARLTSNEHVHRRAMEPIRYTVEHAVEGWYLGPRCLFDIPADQDPGRWPQAVFFRALAGAAEGEQSEDILNAMCRHYIHDDRSDYQHGPFGPRDRVNIESILWCYAHSGDQRLLDKAVGIWEKIPQADHDDLTADRPGKKHGVTFAELTKMAALMYLYTGDPAQLEIATAASRRVFKYHMLCDGTPSTTEGLRGTTSLDGHETCDIVEFNLAWGAVLMATGDGSYADRIERALFNAGMGAVRNDWTGLQYISCPNQLHIARNSCQVGHVGTAAALYGPNSDHRPKYPFITACCAGNVNRLVPTYVQRMWMSAESGGIAAVLYGPSRVATFAGKRRTPIEVVEETSYPFSETILFHVRCEQPAEFPFHLRVPQWCAHPRLKINGQSHPLPTVQNGFIVVNHLFHPGDTVSLELPMSVTSGKSSDGGIYLERGPLVFALQPRVEWTAIAMPEFEITAPDYFPMWAATAKSPWNYALAVDGNAPLRQQVSVRSHPITEDVWANPPVSIEVKAHRTPGWELVHTLGDNPEGFTTPPIPAKAHNLGPQEIISLVPLGSTQIRLAVFPIVNGRDG